MSENENIVDVVAGIFMNWVMHEHNPTYDPTEMNEDINSYFLIKVLKSKLEWAGVDIVIPDFLSCIIALCVENPAEVQMMMVEILEKIKEKKGCIPRHYIVTSNDFVNTFMMKFPIVSQFPEVKAKYDRKWSAQKLQDQQDIDSYYTDNMYDTKDFWLAFKNT